jgi:hypothetical protein
MKRTFIRFVDKSKRFHVEILFADQNSMQREKTIFIVYRRRRNPRESLAVHSPERLQTSAFEYHY